MKLAEVILPGYGGPGNTKSYRSAEWDIEWFPDAHVVWVRDSARKELPGEFVSDAGARMKPADGDAALAELRPPVREPTAQEAAAAQAAAMRGAQASQAVTRR